MEKIKLEKVKRTEPKKAKFQPEKWEIEK